MSAREELPAWAIERGDPSLTDVRADWPHEVSREWAWGGSSGAGVRVCVVDSGVDGDHPRVGAVQRSVAVFRGEDGTRVAEDDQGDSSGHGNACAGIIRSLAPDCELASARVLGAGIKGTGADLLAGLSWAIDSGYDIINLSLSTTHTKFIPSLHELADRAYFHRSVLVCSAHNLPIDSWPWRFASVVSVAGHSGRHPEEFHYNAQPPVEFFAPGEDLDVAWIEGSTITASGNSFATPHIAGLCARILAKHPQLTPFALKSVLFLTASNVGRAR